MKDFCFNKKDRFREKGQAVLIAAVFFMFIAISLILTISAPALSHLKSSSILHSSFKALSAAEGGLEDTFYRFKNGWEVYEEESLDIKGNSVSVIYTENDEIYIESKGVSGVGITRKMGSDLVLGAGINFSYAAQIGEGGLVLEDSASVEGDVFSIGDVVGSGNSISGSVIVTNDNGMIDNVSIGNSAYAYSIENSYIEEDAYYMDLINTNVMGDSYPNTEPLDSVDFPIKKEVIEGWKEFAEEGEVIDCEDSYEIDSDQTLGPAHITCDLEIRGNPKIKIKGHVWVEGNIIIGNSPTIEIDDSLGNESVVFIADDPEDRINGSTIELGNNPEFRGASSSDISFSFLISKNKDAAEGGTTPAITDGQGAGGDVFIYTEKGEVSISNNIDITGLTAYRIRASNNSTVIYQEGLANSFFSTGPSAGFNISRWREVY